ncbi:hypothetical protein [Brevundimonas sp. GCM10030266]|uniref:hypothetical protein n=1 Tax=Brevundimonas sp. GCM10030266 TaxID=3273386 RepID=UPI00361555D0
MRGLVVVAALTLHAVILLPIALSPPREPPPTTTREQVFLVPLDLTDALPRRETTRQRAAGDLVRPPRPRTPPVRATEAAAPAAASPAAPTPDTDSAGSTVADPWNGRRPVTLALPCPPPPGDRIAARLCQVGPPPTDGSDPYADAGPRRLNRSEQAREDGFERQRRANEAWRDYTRGEGAYPGLRALRDR